MLDDLYNNALREQKAMHWQDLITQLKQIQEIQADYRETERLLERAEKKLAEEVHTD